MQGKNSSTKSSLTKRSKGNMQKRKEGEKQKGNHTGKRSYKKLFLELFAEEYKKIHGKYPEE